VILRDLDNLVREYIFASTAGYIYQRFRENVSLQEIAKKGKEELLIKEYIKRTNKKDRKIEDDVVAYAIIIIITLYEDHKKAIGAFEKIDLSKLEWGNRLKEIYMLEVKSTSYKMGQGKATIYNYRQVKSASSSEYNEYVHRSRKGGSKK